MTRELTHLFAWALGEKPDVSVVVSKLDALPYSELVWEAAHAIARRGLSAEAYELANDYGEMQEWCLQYEPTAFRDLALAFAAAIEAMHEQVEAESE